MIWDESTVLVGLVLVALLGVAWLVTCVIEDAYLDRNNDEDIKL